MAVLPISVKLTAPKLTCEVGFHTRGMLSRGGLAQAHRPASSNSRATRRSFMPYPPAMSASATLDAGGSAARNTLVVFRDLFYQIGGRRVTQSAGEFRRAAKRRTQSPSGGGRAARLAAVSGGRIGGRGGAAPWRGRSLRSPRRGGRRNHGRRAADRPWPAPAR